MSISSTPYASPLHQLTHPSIYLSSIHAYIHTHRTTITANRYAEVSAAADEYNALWETYYDEDENPYYYNNSTGESTYDSPF